MTKIKKDVVLLFGCVHEPFSHPDYISFLKAIKKKYKPNRVICMGDEADFHNMSFHDSDPDLHSAGDEHKLTMKGLKRLFALFPKCDVLESNHGSMLLRKALANGIPKAMVKTYNEVLNAPKTWKWHSSLIIKTPLGPVYLTHGKVNAPGKLAQQYGMSSIQAHFHERAQIYYISTPERLMFDMHVGCLVDDKSRAFHYNKLNPKRPIISVGILIDGIPQLIPMILRKNGRWTKKA